MHSHRGTPHPAWSEPIRQDRATTQLASTFAETAEDKSTPLPASGSNSIGQFAERLPSFVPSHTGIGDALPVDQLLPLYQLLSARDQIAFQHHTDNSLIAACNLPCNITANGDLASVVLVTIRMAAIDHYLRPNARLLHLPASLLHRRRIVVDRLPAASKDNVAVRISPRHEDRRLAMLGMPEKVVRLPSRQNRLNSYLDIPRCSVLETHRTR